MPTGKTDLYQDRLNLLVALTKVAHDGPWSNSAIAALPVQPLYPDAARRGTTTVQRQQQTLPPALPLQQAPPTSFWFAKRLYDPCCICKSICYVTQWLLQWVAYVRHGVRAASHGLDQTLCQVFCQIDQWEASWCLPFHSFATSGK